MRDAIVSVRRGPLFEIDLVFTEPSITEPRFMVTSPHIRINSILFYGRGKTWQVEL